MADAGAAPPPSARYADGVSRGEWQDDPAQHPVLAELDRLHHALLAPARPGLLDRLRGRRPAAPPGLYLWGGVGRGKTFLVDLFHDGLPLTPMTGAQLHGTDAPTSARGRPGGKRRTHFHRFMREVHAQLRELGGERDRLATIVRGWRQAGLRVLVLDEFFVGDIGDAMILARLLECMFTEGIVLVTSSNSAPSGLYPDGLQRARFLPAIALIQQHCRVLRIDSDTDYRLRALTRSPVYRTPLDEGAEAWLEARWYELGGDDAHRDGGIVLEGRRIPVRGRCRDMAWFDFSVLCDGPRAAADYIGIAHEFQTVLLGGIPVLDDRRSDAARRFVTLIDELYDCHVNLVCTAAAPPHALYSGERLAGAYDRTASRLVEMQSAAYLASSHHG